MNVRTVSAAIVLASLVVFSAGVRAAETPAVAVLPLPHAEAEQADETPAPGAPKDPPAAPAVPAAAPALDSTTAPSTDAAPAPATLPAAEPAPPPAAVTALPEASEPALPPTSLTRGAPVAIVSVGVRALPPVPSAPRRRMGWGGVGIRYGVSELHLAPSSSLINKVNQASGQTFTPNDFAIDSSAQTLTPTFHLGGSGYFFKLDLPFSFAPAFTTVGLGIYPVNAGVFIERLSLFPYLSLGGAANVVKSHATSEPGTSNKIIGAMVQARGAVGVKYFPVRGFALSAEAGYSHWAAGIMFMPPPGAAGQTQMQGGTGSVVDFSIGAEWL